MKKSLTLLLKLLLLLVIGWMLWSRLEKGWHDVAHPGRPLAIQWIWVLASCLTFLGVMLTSAWGWLALARRMGYRGEALGALGAYTYSQMGKYVPGKVVLLWMRVERSRAFGLSTQLCTLATLLENALYMACGGLVAAATLPFYVQDVRYLLATATAVVLLLGACHPRFFFPLLNRLMRKLDHPPLASELHLSGVDLARSLAGFLPCWFFGGASLWCATRALLPVTLHEGLSLPGGFALSVIGGMASLLPGGLGFKEVVQSLFLIPILQPHVGTSQAATFALAIAGLQRLAQVGGEVLLGLWGYWVSRKQGPK